MATFPDSWQGSYSSVGHQPATLAIDKMEAGEFSDRGLKLMNWLIGLESEKTGLMKKPGRFDLHSWFQCADPHENTVI